ncbi:hypothetical protein [Streptomyces beigongshangae]|uniref:hypothetical protein n=1 Tax=Streptomyces beigongshangae TaxID=2841597 RepID=UPI001C8502D2|nr:hypothetical protein [Streptomyces sp. REN17]
MGEQHGRDWTLMTPDDFGQDAPRPPDAPAAVPAVPDECGTAPLFGDDTPAPRPRGAEQGADPLDEQLGLF